jgi:hypothetical protein
MTRLLARLGVVIVPRRLVPALLDSLITYKMVADGAGGTDDVCTLHGGTYEDTHEVYRILARLT